MKIFKRIIIAAAISALVLGLAGCQRSSMDSADSSNSEKRTVKIAYLPITHALPLYVKNALGNQNFKNITIELVRFGSWPELMDALNVGAVDGASVLIQLAMRAKEQGIDLKAVALGHRDGNVIVVSQDINKTADLKGKTFAIPHRLSTHNVLLNLMLNNAGMSYSDLNIVELPPPEMPVALAEGRISGYVVAEPFGAKSVVSGKGKVLYQSEDIWKNSVCCGLVLRGEFIKNNAAAAEELVKEFISAGKYIEAEGERVDEIAREYMRVEQNVLDLSMQWISFNDLRINENDYNDLRNHLIEMGLSKNPPAYKDFVDNSLVDKVK